MMDHPVNQTIEHNESIRNFKELRGNEEVHKYREISDSDKLITCVHMTNRYGAVLVNLVRQKFRTYNVHSTPLVK